MDEEEEGEKPPVEEQKPKVKHKKKSYIIIIVIIAVVILCIIIALVLYFTIQANGGSGGSSSQGPPDEEQSEEYTEQFVVFPRIGEDLAQKRKRMGKGKKLNFTDANEACKKLSPYGKLFIPEDETEEKRLIDFYLNQSTEYLKICPQIFIGLRVRMLEKYANAFGPLGYILPPDFMDTEDDRSIFNLKERECAIIRENTTKKIEALRKEQYIEEDEEEYDDDDEYDEDQGEENYDSTVETKLETTKCGNAEGVCLLCEMPPSKVTAQFRAFCLPTKDKSCYMIDRPISIEQKISDFEMRCIGKGGRLAVIGTVDLTALQRKIIAESHYCIHHGITSAQIKENIELETIDGVQLQYKTNSLPLGMDINNCIAVTSAGKQPFLYEKCQAQQCYACRIKAP